MILPHKNAEKVIDQIIRNSGLFKNAKKLLTFALGTAILAFGLYNIHERCGVSEGGVLGLALLLYQWFGISPAVSGFILDMSCFIIGTAVMGKGFLGWSVVASAMYALWFRLFEHMGPVLPDFSHQPWTAAVLGACFVGVGVGLVVRYDCAAGGDDALAISVNKLTGLKVSRFYFISDFTVLLLSLSYIPLRRICWSLLSVLISSFIIELLRPKAAPAAAEQT